MAITAPPAAHTVTLSIDGQELTVPEGTTIYDAAKSAGIDIPVLCHHERYESCGKCVPCRVGSTKAHAILSDLIESGGGAEEVDDRIPELEKTMRLTPICGLGQVALGPAISVLGLQRGGTEARPQPRPPRPPDHAAGANDGDSS